MWWGYFVYILVGQRGRVAVAWCSLDVMLSCCNLNLAGSCIVKENEVKCVGVVVTAVSVVYVVPVFCARVGGLLPNSFKIFGVREIL